MTTARDHSTRRRHSSKERGISLVELLVAMSIMSVITAMLLMGWFSLSRSYGFTVHSADARDSARQAMQRLQREVRDAEKPPQPYPLTPGPSDAIIYRAGPYSIAFSTTFNDVGNSTAGWASPSPSPSRPNLVVYRLYADQELWRFEDLDKNGVIANLDLDETIQQQPSDFDEIEQEHGEGARLVLTDVVNYSNSAHRTPVFTYNYYDSSGDLQSEPALYGAERQGIIAVQLELMVDLNPSKAPVYADLRGTAQLRNAR